MAAPAAYLFLGIMHREVLMDINDVRGDAEACVRTLPVVLGRRAALGIAAALSAAAAGVTMFAAATGSGFSWLVRPTKPMCRLARAILISGVGCMCGVVLNACAWPLQWLWSPPCEPYMRALLGGVCLLTQLPLLAAAVRISKSAFEKATVKDAIEGSMTFIGMGLLLTSLMV